MTRRGRFFVYGLLLVFGLVPMLLRGCAPHLEPYPALLLPAGSSMVERRDQSITHRRFLLVGVRSDGSEVQLSPRQFFHPIPAHYWIRIAARRFGVPDTTLRQGVQEARIRQSVGKHRRAARQYGIPEVLLGLVPGSVWTAMAERELNIAQGGTLGETKAWLRYRAAATGLPDATSIRVRLVETTVHIPQDTVIDRQAIQEIISPLAP